MPKYQSVYQIIFAHDKLALEQYIFSEYKMRETITESISHDQ